MHVCNYVRTNIWTYIFTCECIHICTYYEYIQVRIKVFCTNVRTYVCVYIYIFVFMNISTNVCMYICVPICKYVCMNVCMHIRMYLLMYIQMCQFMNVCVYECK